MPRIKTYEQLVIGALMGYPTSPVVYKEEAREILKIVTGQDFGDDDTAWFKWLDSHKYPRRVWRRAVLEVMRRPRKPLLICWKKPQNGKTLGPTPQQVKTCIEELNGDDRYSMLLHTTPSCLLILGGRDGRVSVGFEGLVRGKEWQFWRWPQPKFWAELLDPDVANPDEEILIKIHDEEIFKPRCKTVTKETAIEVALYFLENQTLPKGFHWTEDVEPYT